MLFLNATQVEEKNITSESFPLDMEDVDPGLYIIQYIDSNGKEVLTQKISKL